MIGRVLDRYRIESKLGEGGMGVVYKARDTQLGRAVAIKILPHDKVADADRKLRFIQEAKAASALNHPGIVTIYDIRADAGVDFMVMEYVEGKTLDEIIPPTGVKPAQALRYAVEIADALAKAHGAGIIHRDLKPSNVMVTSNDRIKILDFGLAKLIDFADAAIDETTMASPVTEKGVVLGTFAYMSPEQAEGRHVDARSDIFSFGAMLYQMVTGRKPFAAESSLKMLTKVLNDDPLPPRQVAPAIPLDLEKVIVRCLRKDPARRFQTMADLKAALEDVAQESTAPSPGRRSVSVWSWPVAAAIAAVVIAVFVWREWRTPEAPSSTEPLRALPFTTLAGAERSPSFSPDGDRVAFTWNGPKQDNRDIYVQQVGSGEPLRLTTDPGIDHNPVWSPDGRWIAFLRGALQAGVNEVRLVPPLGGSERKLADIRTGLPQFRSPSRLAWCPDASCLVVADASGEGKGSALFVMSIESGEKRLLRDAASGATLTEPVISPDGKWLVFGSYVGPLTGSLYRQPLGPGLVATGDATRLTDLTSALNSPTWMPDSQEILFAASDNLWRVAIDGRSAATRLPFVGEEGVTPVVSRPQPGRPARLIYARSYSDSNIWRIDTSGPGAGATASPSVAISSTRADLTPGLSPDGRRVAFASSRSGALEIWIANVDGSNAVQLTSMGVTPGFPHFSPDGQLIAFHADTGGGGIGDIYVIPAAGGKPRNLTSHPGMDTFASFSHDGRSIYFSSNRLAVGTSTIWKVPTDGGDAVPVTHADSEFSRASPDGSQLYYSGGLQRGNSVWRMPLAGGDEVKLLDNIVPFSYAVIAQGIYYLARVAGETHLQFFDFTTRRSTIVARNLGNVNSLTASADGRTILYSRVDSSVDDLMLVENFR